LGRHSPKQLAIEGKPEAYRKLYPGYRYRPKVRTFVGVHVLERLAYEDSVRIRAIWRERFLTDRRKPDAAWFAAQLWGVDADKVRSFKPSGKRRAS
jgi:hypothetical protein